MTFGTLLWVAAVNLFVEKLPKRQGDSANNLRDCCFLFLAGCWLVGRHGPLKPGLLEHPSQLRYCCSLGKLWPNSAVVYGSGPSQLNTPPIRCLTCWTIISSEVFLIKHSLDWSSLDWLSSTYWINTWLKGSRWSHMVLNHLQNYLTGRNR